MLFDFDCQFGHVLELFHASILTPDTDSNANIQYMQIL